MTVVKYLLRSHAPLVASATVNANNELPIHLLCNAGKEDKVDKESTEYIETIWLLANPALPLASYICQEEKLDQSEVATLDKMEGETLHKGKEKKKSWRKNLNPFRLFLFSRKR